MGSSVHRITGPARTLLPCGLPSKPWPPWGIPLLCCGAHHGLQVDVYSSTRCGALPHQTNGTCCVPQVTRSQEDGPPRVTGKLSLKSCSWITLVCLLLGWIASTLGWDVSLHLKLSWTCLLVYKICIFFIKNVTELGKNWSLENMKCNLELKPQSRVHVSALSLWYGRISSLMKCSEGPGIFPCICRDTEVGASSSKPIQILQNLGVKMY